MLRKKVNKQKKVVSNTKSEVILRDPEPQISSTRNTIWDTHTRTLYHIIILVLIHKSYQHNRIPERIIRKVLAVTVSPDIFKKNNTAMHNKLTYLCTSYPNVKGGSHPCKLY